MNKRIYVYSNRFGRWEVGEFTGDYNQIDWFVENFPYSIYFISTPEEVFS